MKFDILNLYILKYDFPNLEVQNRIQFIVYITFKIRIFEVNIAPLLSPVK